MSIRIITTDTRTDDLEAAATLRLAAAAARLKLKGMGSNP
jgi:hypothetical protein